MRRVIPAVLATACSSSTVTGELPASMLRLGTVDVTIEPGSMTVQTRFDELATAWTEPDAFAIEREDGCRYVDGGSLSEPEPEIEGPWLMEEVTWALDEDTQRPLDREASRPGARFGDTPDRAGAPFGQTLTLVVTPLDGEPVRIAVVLPEAPPTIVEPEGSGDGTIRWTGSTGGPLHVDVLRANSPSTSAVQCAITDSGAVTIPANDRPRVTDKDGQAVVVFTRRQSVLTPVGEDGGIVLHAVTVSGDVTALGK